MNKALIQILFLLIVPNTLVKTNINTHQDNFKKNFHKDTTEILPYSNTSSFTNADSSEIKAQKIIDKYISAVGGRDSLEKIMDRVVYLTGYVNNVEADIIIYQKIPDKYYQKTELGAVEQKIIYDGKKGTLITGDDVQEIRDDDLYKLKYEAIMQLILYLNAYGVKPEYEGIEKIDDLYADKIILNFPGGMKWIQYYDANSYLKIKEIKTITSPDSGIFQQESFFYDYREVEGIKYPFKIEQYLGPSRFIFTVDSIKVNSGIINRNFEF